MGDNHADVVRLNQEIDAIQQPVNVSVVVLFSIKEVDDGVDHDEVGFVIGDLIADHLDVTVSH